LLAGLVRVVALVGLLLLLLLLRLRRHGGRLANGARHEVQAALPDGARCEYAFERLE